MDSSSEEGVRPVKGLPLIMANHTITENSHIFPRAGVDFVHDDGVQKASWSNPDSTNKWSPTAYGDSGVDGVDNFEVNFVFPAWPGEVGHHAPTWVEIEDRAEKQVSQPLAGLPSNKKRQFSDRRRPS